MRIEFDSDLLPPLPDGEWDYVGVKQAEKGEWYCRSFAEKEWLPWVCDTMTFNKYFCIRPVKYREPVLPADWGRECEFSNDKETWTKGTLAGYLSYFFSMNRWYGRFERECGAQYSSQYNFARIEVSE
jgi:hypothetical protein